MHKRIIGILLLLTISISLSSCSRKTLIEHGIDPDLHNAVPHYHDEERDEFYLEYQGEKYFVNRVLWEIFSVSGSDLHNMIQLGWNYNFPFSVTVVYWSYTNEKPDFIITSSTAGSIYTKESFDIGKTVLEIEGTEIEIEFSEMIAPGEEGFYAPAYSSSYIPDFELVLHSNKYGIKTYANIAYVDCVYYMAFGNSITYRMSDTFRDLLIENQLIPDNRPVIGPDTV